MSSREQTFRVFQCPHCGYTGYRIVHSEDEDSICNLCSKTITPTPETKHVSSLEDAKYAIQSIVLKRTTPKTKSRHGLGVKRRVMNMVSDLSDLNRGRGVSRKRVLQECKGADIDLEKADRFLGQLEEEGHVINIDGQLTPTEGEPL